MLAQGPKARMHLRRGRTGDRARLAVRGPELGFGMRLGQVFEDGKAVPRSRARRPGGLAPCRRGVTQDLCLQLGLAQLDVDLAERQPACRMAIQGRRLQLDQYLLPITSS